MCVAIPPVVSQLLKNDLAMELVAAEGNVQSLSAVDDFAQIGTSDRRMVTGEIVGQEVRSVRLVRNRGLVDWYVRLDEYPGIVKLLTSLQFRGLLPKLRAEGARLTSLYAMTDGSGLIRVNGTDAGAYSIRSLMSPTGELSGLEIAP